MGNGALWDNLELSNQYRMETRDYVEQCLGLTAGVRREFTKPANAAIQAFGSIGTAIRLAYNYGTPKSRCSVCL